MEFRKTAVERAFELASSGSCQTIRDIAYKLNAEKYDISHLEGPALRKQLLALIAQATKPMVVEGEEPGITSSEGPDTRI